MWLPYYYSPIIHCQACPQPLCFSPLQPFRNPVHCCRFLFHLLCDIVKKATASENSSGSWSFFFVKEKMGRRPLAQKRQGKAPTAKVKANSLLICCFFYISHLVNIKFTSWKFCGCFLDCFICYFGSCFGQWLIVLFGQC